MVDVLLAEEHAQDTCGGVGLAISNSTGYGTPNEKAAPLLARPVPFPTPEEMAKLEYIQDLGADAQAWDQLWTEIKAG